MLLKNINILNQIAWDSIGMTDSVSIFKKYTEESIRILNADYGFAYGKFIGDTEYKLVYKSANSPTKTPIPKNTKGSHYLAIPIVYKEHIYGSIVVGYKKKHFFARNERALAHVIGFSITSVMTVNWLIENEQHALAMAERQKEMQVLFEQEKLKTEFITNAAHELRTPLAIIKGNVDLALEGASKKILPSKSALKAIDYETKHLSNILSDLTLITSREGELKNRIVHEKVDLKSLIAKVVSRCKVIARDKNVSVVSKEVGSTVVSGDALYLENMLTNLVTNSIVYGNTHGHTTISVKKSKESITICVQDDGIGISEQDLPHIFERFYRADKSHSSDGTGLGLAIVKWIAQAHEGRVTVESKLGKGSCFCVSLPIQHPKR